MVGLYSVSGIPELGSLVIGRKAAYTHEIDPITPHHEISPNKFPVIQTFRSNDNRHVHGAACIRSRHLLFE